MGSAGEVTYCQLSIENNVRLDGRQCLDMRPVELELGVIAQAAGSARLHMGATDVVVGVKVRVLVATDLGIGAASELVPLCRHTGSCRLGTASPACMHEPSATASARDEPGACAATAGQVEVGSPSSSAPEQGQLQVTVEFSPCASPMFQASRARAGPEGGALGGHPC